MSGDEWDGMGWDGICQIDVANLNPLMKQAPVFHSFSSPS